MLYGLLNLSFWGYVIAALVLTHITIASVTIYLHRHQAHGALKLHAIPSHFFRFWLWLTTGMITKGWVSIHRKHHARCETKEDPHSPQVLGISTVLWQGVELYRREHSNAETLERFGHGTPDDWLERNVYTPHPKSGILLLYLVDLLLFGVPGITIWAIQMLWIPFFAAGVVNGIGHYWGYRNFECADASTNISPWGIIIGGEELHNNHHTYPTSAKLSVKWWEFDIGWMYISLLQMIGLAEVKRTPPKAVLNVNKSIVDADTLKGVLSNRFQILADYTKEVILPVYNEEKRKADERKRNLLAQIKNSMVRADSLVDEQSKLRLKTFLENSAALNQVYQFRLKLQDIWSKTTATQRELIDALQEWCKQADATGINVLQRFSKELRHYVASR